MLPVAPPSRASLYFQSLDSRCHRLPRVHRRLRVCLAIAEAQHDVPSTSTSTSASNAQTRPDPFVAAAARLQGLLANVGSGEEELIGMLVAEEPPEAKMQTITVLGAVLTIVAVVISTLCGNDPWGGMSFSPGSFGAAAIGLAACLPLAVARHLSWTPAAYAALPALEDMHRTQLAVARPWLSRMSAAHAFWAMALETLPLTLLMLPAAQGGLITAMLMYNSVLHNSLGLTVPEDAAAVLALLLTALLTSAGRALELDVDVAEYEVVENARDNSDRYYHLMATDVDRNAVDAQSASRAFTAVAQAWLDTRGDACSLAGSIAFLDVVFLGGLWYMTGDLAAPAAAALCINWADTHRLHTIVSNLERKVAHHSSSDGSNGGGGRGNSDNT